jgi:hypothetical protein
MGGACSTHGDVKHVYTILAGKPEVIIWENYAEMGVFAKIGRKDVYYSSGSRKGSVAGFY